MPEDFSVSGLEQANVVVHKAFKEVEEFLAIAGVFKSFHGGEVLCKEVGVRVIEGVVF
jgi:hypothetical protein